MEEVRNIEYKFSKAEVLEALNLWMNERNTPMEKSKDMILKAITTHKQSSMRHPPPPPPSALQKERNKVFNGIRVIVND